MVKNYSEAEVKVREATSNDPWGPSSTLMSEISDLTYNIVALGEVMRMIWKRLNDHGKNWRHVYKSLVLLDYLIKNGNEKVAQQCKEHIVAIQTLKDFQYMEEQKDQGQSVREKAKQLVNLLRDDERLKQERTKAFKARERFAQNAMGISSDNKLTFATSNMNQANQSRSSPYSMAKAGGSYSDPYGGATSAAHSSVTNDPLAADLEAVRPSDTNEEDLQIKLAIMLSQQEHEEEVQRKRADDTKLTLAIEQSKSEGQPNGLVDLGDTGFSNNYDPWSSDNKPTNAQFGKDQEPDSGSDELFPPLFSTTQQQSSKQLVDPWSSVQQNGSNFSEQNGQFNQLSAANNPWQSNSAVSADPWAAVPSQPPKADDFDLFTSDRAINQSPLTSVNQNSKNNPSTDPFGDFFGTSTEPGTTNNSTNPWNSTKPSEMFPTQLNNSQKPGDKLEAKCKTPESFLGENSSLVNLENLIPARPKSTNPFGTNQILTTLSTSNSSGQLNNPFVAQQQLMNQKNPTISQLQAENQQKKQSSFPSFGQNNEQVSQLPQPLLPASNSQSNLLPLSFNQPPMAATGAQQNIASFNAFNSTNNQNSNQNTNPFLMM